MNTNIPNNAKPTLFTNFNANDNQPIQVNPRYLGIRNVRGIQKMADPKNSMFRVNQNKGFSPDAALGKRKVPFNNTRNTRNTRNTKRAKHRRNRTRRNRTRRNRTRRN